MSSDFNQMNLSPAMHESLARLRFTKPTAVQERAVPLMLEGRNVVGQAQTGSGKTLAFAIPILERIKTGVSAPQALIVAPTRELVLQICQVFQQIRPRNLTANTVPIYGGASKVTQRHSMRRGSQIIVATTGRLLDFLREGAIRLDQIHTLVLDEADRMFEMGFIDDVRLILSRIPQKSQIALFCATLPPPIQEIVRKYVPNPEYIRLAHHAADKPKINQQFFHVQPSEKLKTLLVLLEGRSTSTLVFCRTRRGADRVAIKLLQSGHRVAAIHGGKTQNKRDDVMRGFRAGRLAVLVATDLASRGLDITNVGSVVNYDIPLEAEDYVHRIGRTARAGKEGASITFITPMDGEQVRRIERLTGVRISSNHGTNGKHRSSPKFAPPASKTLPNARVGL